jgi:hypothetical protein
VKPDEDVSPYLRQPLRTLEQAQQDRKRQQSQIAVTKAKSARWPDPPRTSLEAVDDVSVNLQTIAQSLSVRRLNLSEVRTTLALREPADRAPGKDASRPVVTVRLQSGC